MRNHSAGEIAAGFAISILVFLAAAVQPVPAGTLLLSLVGALGVSFYAAATVVRIVRWRSGRRRQNASG